MAERKQPGLAGEVFHPGRDEADANLRGFGRLPWALVMLGIVIVVWTLLITFGWAVSALFRATAAAFGV